VQPPAILRCEKADDPLEERHSGVRGGTTAPSLRTALAERRTRGELRTAPAAQRVHANAVCSDLTQDRPLHRDEERQRARSRHGWSAAEETPSRPGTYSADQLTKGLHGSLAATVTSTRPPSSGCLYQG
jgi:anti-sigma factor RsiW